MYSIGTRQNVVLKWYRLNRFSPSLEFIILKPQHRMMQIQEGVLTFRENRIDSKEYYTTINIPTS